VRNGDILQMHRYLRMKQLQFPTTLIVLTLLLLMCSACGVSSTVSSPARPSATVSSSQPVQPITGQQLLSQGPITYVALGASDAVGVGSNKPGSQGYVPLIANRLPSGSRLINLGVSGIKLHAALKEELPLALSTSPRLITIWLVANDFVAGVPYNDYMQDLETLLKQLRAGTQARIVMANLPDLTRLPAFARRTADQKATMLKQIQRWNAGIAALATRYHVALVDLFTRESELTTHPEYVSIDGFHPSPSGYVQLANYFWAIIKE
jgi:acyl-CoA thioesterase-1